MREGTRTALLEKGQFDEETVKWVIAAAKGASPDDRIRAGLEALVELAETDPVAARSALHELRSDHFRLSQIEAWLGDDPDRATFGLGAAIRLADTELASPTPNLEQLTPELLIWLEFRW
jgi:hypothetical protein